MLQRVTEKRDPNLEAQSQHSRARWEGVRALLTRAREAGTEDRWNKAARGWGLLRLDRTA